jgi:hypothetical protein
MTSGSSRPDFGLGDLFGVRYAGLATHRMQNAYLTVRKDPATGKYHAILRGLEDAGAHRSRRAAVHVSANDT